MKKKQKVQIFKLEERVLFDGAAAAEIAAAVDQAAEQNQNQADDHSDNSEQGKEDKLIRNTVQNAGISNLKKNTGGKSLKLKKQLTITRPIFHANRKNFNRASTRLR